MLRIASISLLLAMNSITAAPVPVEKPKDVDPLLGKWKVVELLVGGVGAGKTNDDSAAFIDKDKIVFTGIPKEPDDLWTYKRDPNNKTHIDLGHMHKPGEILEFKGRFDLDGDTLVIAFALDPKQDRPKGTKSGPMVATVKLERVKVKGEKK